MPHTIAVDPDVFLMGSQETLPIGFDVTALLDVGESPTSPTAELIQLDTNANYAAGLSGTVQTTDNVLTQTVTDLIPRKRYRLIIAFTAAAGKVFAPYLNIECVH